MGQVRAREKSVAQGRKTKTGYTPPLSGFAYCADCGSKLKMSGTWKKDHSKYVYSYNCGDYMRFGKTLCFSHFIQANTLEGIVLDDIRTMAQRIVLDEDAIKKEFIRHNAELADKAVKSAKKELQVKQRRVEELSRLMQVAYEDRVKGKMPEDICVGFLQKYSDEQKTLTAEIEELEEKLSKSETTRQSADDFIRDIKKYLNAPTLTGKERTIDIVYKVDIASVLRYKLNK